MGGGYPPPKPSPVFHEILIRNFQQILNFFPAAESLKTTPCVRGYLTPIDRS